MDQDNDNISTRIAKEEHFVTPGQSRKDPNAVYIEDNPQKALEKLLNLTNITNYQEKLQYVKHLAELIEVIGEEGFNNLKTIMSIIQNDRDDIKRALITQITPLVSLLQKRNEKGYQEIVNVILLTVMKLLSSFDYNIKEQAGQELLKIAAILTADDRGKHLLTRILGMAHDDDNEENRMIAVRLLSQMAPILGKDLCEQFVGLEFLSMGEDPQWRVRKEAVSNLSSIGKVVFPTFFKQRLLPFYLRLCKDTNWSVRKACVENIYEITNLCKGTLMSIRQNELTNVMLIFLKDSNKSVKVAAYKTLGAFISTLEELRVNEKLVESYLQMTDNSINNLAPDNEILYACAYNFPAVLLTLGRSNWPKLVKLFQALLRSEDKVRKPLAYALHEIAKIIGEEKTEKDLLFVLERFLKDTNDDIKHGVIQNLALFLKVFHINKREDMIDIILNLQKDQKKWRDRELIAKQIDKLTMVFSTDINFRILAPISFKLCNDSVAIVREEASKKIYALLRALYNSEEDYRDCIIQNIKGFSKSSRYTNRQAFVFMCEKIMKDPEIFKTHFLDSLVSLAYDKVTSVRIVLAKTLKKLYYKERPICNDPQILQLIKKLKDDPSKDVRNLVQSIFIPDEHRVLENLDEISQSDNKSSQETGVSGQSSEKTGGLSQEDGDILNQVSSPELISLESSKVIQASEQVEQQEITV